MSTKKKSTKKNSKKKSNKRIVSRKTKSIYNGGGNYIDYKVGEKDSKYIYDEPAIIRVASNDLGIIPATLKKGYYYEKHLIMIAAQFLKPGDVVLDIGTNVGCVTIPLSKIVGNNGRIHSFEPFLKTRKALEYNLSLIHI